MATTAEIAQIQGVELVAGTEDTYTFSTISTINSVGGDTGFDQLELFLYRKAADIADDEYIQLCSVGDRLEYENDRDDVDIGDYYRKDALAVKTWDNIGDAVAWAAAELTRLQYLVDDWEALITAEMGTDTTTVDSTSS